MASPQEQLLARFREVLTRDWERGELDGTPLVSRLSSAVICTRHFAQGEDVATVARLLSIAAEVTGIPQETMTGSYGQPVVVWRPARGELFLQNDVNDVAPACWTPAPPGFPE